jgi:uncharacterized membrane protein
MNRLKNTRCYLCGAMDRVKDGGVGWRAEMKERLGDLGIVWLDPCCKPTTLAVENSNTRKALAQAKEAGAYDVVTEQVKIIRCIDLRMTDIADFVVVNLDTDVHACGTYEEIANANRQKKPIIVHVEQGKKNAPSWLFGMLPHQMIFSTWEEVDEYLRHVNEDEQVDRSHRWYFFDLEVKSASPVPHLKRRTYLILKTLSFETISTTAQFALAWSMFQDIGACLWFTTVSFVMKSILYYYHERCW